MIKTITLVEPLLNCNRKKTMFINISACLASAENSFLPLVCFTGSGLYPVNIPGVSYWKKSEQARNPTSKTRIDMDTPPNSDLTLLDRSSLKNKGCFLKMRGLAGKLHLKKLKKALKSLSAKRYPLSTIS